MLGHSYSFQRDLRKNGSTSNPTLRDEIAEWTIDSASDFLHLNLNKSNTSRSTISPHGGVSCTTSCKWRAPPISSYSAWPAMSQKRNTDFSCLPWKPSGVFTQYQIATLPHGVHGGSMIWPFPRWQPKWHLTPVKSPCIWTNIFHILSQSLETITNLGKRMRGCSSKWLSAWK